MDRSVLATRLTGGRLARAAGALMLAAALTVIAAACGGGSSDEAAVRSAATRELVLVKKQDWRAAYQMLSPRARTACPYDEFLKLLSSARASDFDWSQIGYDEVKVRLAGDTAYVTYITTYEGKDIDATTDSDPDVWVRVDGKWYDDDRAFSSCGGSGSGNRPIPAVSPEPGAASSSAPDNLPSGFPSDFPVYPGASVVGSATAPLGGKVVRWTSVDSVEEVREFYKKQFKDGPWKSDRPNSGVGDSDFFVDSPDGKLFGLVRVTEDNGRSLILASFIAN